MSMKRNKTGWIVALLLMLVMVFAVNTQVSAATKARLNYYTKTSYVGDIFKLKVTGGTVKQWKSANTSVAKVSKYGNVKGLKAGTVRIYAYLKNGSKKYCTLTVKNKPSNTSAYLNKTQTDVFLNILGAVETGGQVYGNRSYSAFAGPGTSSPSEYSATAGAYQEYGENLRQLLIAIQKQYPAVFKKYDNAGIATDIKRVWYDSSPYTVKSGSKKAKAIVNIISSSQGKQVQDARAVALLDSYLKHIKSLGVTNVRAALFLAECEHLGGSSPVERIVKRAGNKNSMASLRTSLYKDQNDKSNSYQIGDAIYQTRHEKCYSWIKQNISSSAKLK